MEVINNKKQGLEEMSPIEYIYFLSSKVSKAQKSKDFRYNPGFQRFFRWAMA